MSASVAPPTQGAGFKTFTLPNPLGRGRINAVAFYPSKSPSTTVTVGPYRIEARRNGPIESGGHALVVLSHGTGGSEWDLHDYGEFLARAGYVVAALTHPGDNYADRSGLGTDRVLIGRERDMSALIDAVLRDPELSPHVDTSKIAAAGFSAGGYTALVLAGAKPDFAMLAAHCRREPRDGTFCWNGARTTIRTTGLRVAPDRRVRAVIAMAPVGLYFDRVSFAHFHVPVLLLDGQRDEVLSPAENSRYIARLLGLPRRRFIMISKAGHLVFLSSCTPQLRAEAKTVCVDPPGVVRQDAHETVERAMLSFLSQTL